MNKAILLPKLAWTSMKKNISVYLPYMLTLTISMAVIFIFCCIAQNPIMMQVPHASYAIMVLFLVIALLSIVMVGFLTYTNSVLIKRRKKELGLYTILGLEKKHIAVLMTIEALMINLISLVMAILLSMVFSKLIFMVLLKLCNLSSEIKFTFNLNSFQYMIGLFSFIFILNLIFDFHQVNSVNPIDLMKESNKGEKEPRFLALRAFCGFLFTGIGYAISLTSHFDSFIFVNFFIAVFFVILGMHFIFKAGITFILKKLKNNQKYYYKKENFINVSGMYFRMKKSASSLVNISLFSTMIMVVLMCTVALSLGEKDSVKFVYPYDVKVNIQESETGQLFTYQKQLQTLAQKDGVKLKDMIQYTTAKMSVMQEENAFRTKTTKEEDNQLEDMIFVTLQEYNEAHQTNESLMDGEVLIFKPANDYGFDTITIDDKTYHVKQELKSSNFESKNINNMMQNSIYVILPDQESFDAYTALSQISVAEKIKFNISGNQNAAQQFCTEIDENQWGFSYYTMQDIYSYTNITKSMDGGLLFIGIFFSIIICIFLVLVMYYKQISEGYEDQDLYQILSKVGLSEEDSKATIRQQIKLVFMIPAAIAILNTLAGMKLFVNMMYALNLFNTKVMIGAFLIVILCFIVFYIVSYMQTAKSYYKIVSK